MNSSASDELSLLSAQDLAALVRARKVSPVEVLQSVLSRIERHEPRLNALVVLDREGALRAARQAEDAVIKGGPLGPLHGGARTEPPRPPPAARPDQDAEADEYPRKANEVGAAHRLRP